MIDYSKPILCLDFDGVIHSYTSGWKGARNIPDMPVAGALEFLCKATDEFDVHIFSSRSRYFGGRRAMKRWLRDRYTELAFGPTEIPAWLLSYIGRTAFADPWDYEVGWAVKKLISKIKFPLEKPAALVTIDDRAICFDGTFPSFNTIKAFRPWNRRSQP
jgi:hypothetical protein